MSWQVQNNTAPGCNDGSFADKSPSTVGLRSFADLVRNFPLHESIHTYIYERQDRQTFEVTRLFKDFMSAGCSSHQI